MMRADCCVTRLSLQCGNFDEVEPHPVIAFPVSSRLLLHFDQSGSENLRLSSQNRVVSTFSFAFVFLFVFLSLGGGNVCLIICLFVQTKAPENYTDRRVKINTPVGGQGL